MPPGTRALTPPAHGPANMIGRVARACRITTRYFSIKAATLRAAAPGRAHAGRAALGGRSRRGAPGIQRRRAADASPLRRTGVYTCSHERARA